MSRSRKKTSCFSDYGRKRTSFMKRQANKVVRKYKGIIPNGNSYKKLFCSWAICDYKFCKYSKPMKPVCYGYILFTLKEEQESYFKGLRK